MAENNAKEILIAKEKLDQNLIDYLSEFQKLENDPVRIQILTNSLFAEHTRTLNTISNSIGQVHQSEDLFTNEDLRNDYTATIENFTETSFKIIDLLRQIVIKYDLPDFKYSANSFITSML